MELAKNQEHIVTIEGYGEGGMGVARIDGRVVFVHGALRGEKCRVLILKTLKSVAFAKVLEVIEPSGARVESDCPYFPRCGGCTYRHMSYEEELRLKKQRVQDNLARIGGSAVVVRKSLVPRTRCVTATRRSTLCRRTGEWAFTAPARTRSSSASIAFL